MSDIEKLNSVKFNIRKVLESQGSDITADTPFEEYPKYVMELNSGEGQSAVGEGVLIDEQSFSGTKPASEYPFYIAQLTGVSWVDETIIIYFDNVRYEVTSETGQYGAEVNSQTGVVDWSEYPFVLVPVEENGAVVAVADNNIHTIKVTVLKDIACPAGMLYIGENNTYDVKDYESVNVNVSGSTSGTIDIQSNGTYDVSEYASANVNVPNPSSGTLSISYNGTFDVTNYANVQVSVGSSVKYGKITVFNSANSVDSIRVTSYEVTTGSTTYGRDIKTIRAGQSAQIGVWLTEYTYENKWKITSQNLVAASTGAELAITSSSGLTSATLTAVGNSENQGILYTNSSFSTYTQVTTASNWGVTFTVTGSVK